MWLFVELGLAVSNIPFLFSTSGNGKQVGFVLQNFWKLRASTTNGDLASTKDTV